jgi:outer membrane protein
MNHHFAPSQLRRPLETARGQAASRIRIGVATIATVLALAGSPGAVRPSQASEPEGTEGPAALADHLTGDLGLAVYSHRRPVPTDDRASSLLPYAVADYQRFYARIDTLGVKTVPLGSGWLELAMRVSFDGYTPSRSALPGISERKDPVPIGLGTLQRTPVGALIFNAFHDVNASGGHLVEAIWTGRVRIGAATVFPQLGVEYRSQAYNQYYFGVSPAEATANGSFGAYAAGASTRPLAGFLVEYPITNQLKAVGYLRRRWLPSTVTDSPLVNRTTLDTAFAGLAWSFE